jgi:hypothetical protein
MKLVEDDTPGLPDQRLPDPHTCSLDIDLPSYSSRKVLREKLQFALDSFRADPTFNVPSDESVVLHPYRTLPIRY